MDDQHYALAIALTDSALLAVLLAILLYNAALRCKEFLAMRRVVRCSAASTFTARTFCTAVVVAFVLWQLLPLAFYFSLAATPLSVSLPARVYYAQLQADMLATVSDLLAVLLFLGMALFLFVPRAAHR